MKKHSIEVNFGNLKSIKQAEMRKKRLENAGYQLVSEKQVGLDKFKMTYVKPKAITVNPTPRAILRLLAVVHKRARRK
jgi:hypothetical protein